MHFSCLHVIAGVWCLSDEENGWNCDSSAPYELSAARRAQKTTVRKLIGVVDAFSWFTLLLPQYTASKAEKKCCLRWNIVVGWHFTLRSRVHHVQSARRRDSSSCFPHVAGETFLNYWSCVDSREGLCAVVGVYESFFYMHNLAEECIVWSFLV